ncbi:hypothetical protein P691DRAFT_764172 [Macrolepiota fuliginosa MF-IS2]|uniref:Uncharacterized protein n=1 Tax=Macrolepiota fuliginosa MF-IS2 TaxID=1400762 RepID=A0A9P5X360_9AGAR|nr:hypothetical protein P691DRAFT_764172 [Macrolepiota fuliginosa MF-IS2]
MAHKPCSKYANQPSPGPVPLLSLPMPTSPVRLLVPLVNISSATRQFLTSMNQDLWVHSKFSTEELEWLVLPMEVRFGIFAKLIDKLKFQPISVLEGTPQPTPIEVDEEENNEDDYCQILVKSMADAANALAACGMWCHDKKWSSLEANENFKSFYDNLRRLSGLFGFLPNTHKCPTPLPCT